MCILHVEQCSECSDKFSVLQHVQECSSFYITKLYCEDITLETKFYVCDICNQSTWK